MAFTFRWLVDVLPQVLESSQLPAESSGDFEWLFVLGVVHSADSEVRRIVSRGSSTALDRQSIALKVIEAPKRGPGL
jgi:hypothetical protein